MKEKFIKDIKKEENVQDFFMLKSINIRENSNGKQYLDMTLEDASGRMNGKKWEVEPKEAEVLEPGQIVKIKAVMHPYNNTPQLKVTKIRLAEKSDGLNRKDFFKTAPESPADMYEFITGKISSFEDDELKKICLTIYDRNKEKLMYYPAAMSNHHAEYAGLLWHVKRMMMAGEKMCEIYSNLNRDLLLAGIAVHDIEKINEIMSDKNGVSTGYSFEGQMIGHIVRGVGLIHELGKELAIDEEKSVLLEHMILSHHYEPEYGSPKKPLFPEAEMLHHLDNIDAKMYDMEESLSGVKPGEFGEKVWTLDNRKLYKRRFK